MPVINVITKNDRNILTAQEGENDPDILKIELTVGIYNPENQLSTAIFITKEELKKIYQIYGEK